MWQRLQHYVASHSQKPFLPSPSPVSLVLFTLVLDLIYFRQPPKFVLSKYYKFCSDNEEQQWRTCQEKIKVSFLGREYKGDLAHRKLWGCFGSQLRGLALRRRFFPSCFWLWIGGEGSLRWEGRRLNSSSLTPATLDSIEPPQSTPTSMSATTSKSDRSGDICHLSINRPLTGKLTFSLSQCFTLLFAD